ncbi:MAG TPA: class I SAM-dependent methyltransferase [Polyangia bacterium]|jgi:SAM-dependent methyltransferase|nr:class I SAM-dependent methyltransferase [Polyangia bacterium]
MTGAAFKDLFSRQAADYAKFRPTYPGALFAWLASVTPVREVAVDVGAGNGQAAQALAAHFQRVFALEPSAAQLAHAPSLDRVTFQRGAAEATGLPDGSADVLVAAQAFHWFDQATFFAEVGRVVRPGGTLALWCYANATITPPVDAIVHELYQRILGPYWEPERRLVETGYATVPVPFSSLQAPPFHMSVEWTFEQLVGYLMTWSSLQRCVRETGNNPLQPLLVRLETAWAGAVARTVTWPLFVRAFRV